MRIKVCGMTKLEQIRQLNEIGIEFAGFIFYPKSPRYVKKFNLSAIDLKREKMQISRVGVFVNERSEDVLKTVDHWRLDMVQLHGDETPKYCEQISNHVTTIKAFRIGEGENVDWKINPYQACVDMFLFDTVGVHYGGTGQQFDWSLIGNARILKPYFLSGGIGPEDTKAVKEFAASQMNLFAVDVNSKFELMPGVKDMDKVREFRGRLRD
jgi:phosphoribosylanthranilate isomerase